MAGAVTEHRNGWLRESAVGKQQFVAADRFDQRGRGRLDEESALRETAAHIAVRNGADQYRAPSGS